MGCSVEASGADDGFLKTDDGDDDNKGFVSFTVQVRNDVSSAEEDIKNKAFIQFDQETSFPTNEVVTDVSLAPEPPILRSPANRKTGVATDIVLSWNRSDYASDFRVFLTPDGPAGQSTGDEIDYQHPAPLQPNKLYRWQVIAVSTTGATAASEEWTFTTGSGASKFLRGDANNSGKVDISDAQYILSFLFLGGPAPKCLDAGDTNDDTRDTDDDTSTLDLSDGVYLLNWLFLGGRIPPPPSPPDEIGEAPVCGPDPTFDDIGCDGPVECL
jgi:hypothetical protein